MLHLQIIDVTILRCCSCNIDVVAIYYYFGVVVNDDTGVGIVAIDVVPIMVDEVDGVIVEVFDVVSSVVAVPVV